MLCYAMLYYGILYYTTLYYTILYEPGAAWPQEQWPPTLPWSSPATASPSGPIVIVIVITIFNIKDSY